MRQTDVVVLDDSIMMREFIQRELERDVNIRVVGKAANPIEARDMIVMHRPDVLICDVNIEIMSGVDFVKQLLPQYYIPVIMMSSNAAFAQTAKEINAHSFVVKPTLQTNTMSDFSRMLLLHIKSIVNKETTQIDAAKLSSKVIVIGASTGGAEAIESVLTKLPSLIPPIVIAQHMPAKFTHSFAARLNNAAALSVKEAENNDVLLPGQVYIAPGGLHTTIRRSDTRFLLKCDENTQGLSTCPNIDMLFVSAATYVGSDCIGCLLTGMGKDGAEGLLKIRQLGGKTIGQDRRSSIIYGMPKVAHDIGAVETQVSLDKIAQKLVNTYQTW